MPTALPEAKLEPEIEIRYAKTEPDITAIHRFLLVVAAPFAVDGIDVVKSLQEVIRVAEEGAALMAVIDGMMIGTMGLMGTTWWHNNTNYITDRWDFTLPEYWHGPPHIALMDEAKKIAAQAGLRFLYNGKLRDGKGGVLRVARRLYSPEPVTESQGA